MEGARWNWNAGLIEESLPREMAFALPVVCARAVLVDKQEKNGVYRWSDADTDKQTTQQMGQHRTLEGCNNARLICSMNAHPGSELCSLTHCFVFSDVPSFFPLQPCVQDAASRRFLRLHRRPAHEGTVDQVVLGWCGARHGGRRINLCVPFLFACSCFFLRSFAFFCIFVFVAVPLRRLCVRAVSTHATSVSVPISMSRCVLLESVFVRAGVAALRSVHRFVNFKASLLLSTLRCGTN